MIREPQALLCSMGDPQRGGGLTARPDAEPWQREGCERGGGQGQPVDRSARRARDSPRCPQTTLPVLYFPALGLNYSHARFQG